MLLGEDLVQAVREVGLEEGVTRRGGVVVILLGEDRTGGVSGDDGDDALLDAGLGDDVGNALGHVDVGGLAGEGVNR